MDGTKFGGEGGSKMQVLSVSSEAAQTLSHFDADLRMNLRSKIMNALAAL